MGTAIVIFDIDGVVRDVSGSYRRAIADTVEHFTRGKYRPTPADIDQLKTEGVWNNDWKASEELVYRYFERRGEGRETQPLDYEAIVEYFQIRYRGPEDAPFTGYIQEEPLLMSREYLHSLDDAGIPWGFFSGATRASAEFVLDHRLGLKQPPLVAMGDAPDKPDPMGLFAIAKRLSQVASPVASTPPPPVIYAGDTVADMHTIRQARGQQPQGQWIAVGVLPPHVQETEARAERYGEILREAGADLVVANIEALTPEQIAQLVQLPQARRDALATPPTAR